MLRSLVLTWLCFVLTGCIHGGLFKEAPRDDSSPGAAESGYPTAEFRTRDGLHHGSAQILLRQGEKLDAVEFHIQGYYDGTIRVDSERCGLSQSYTYTDHKLLKVPLEGTAHESCIIDFVVQPSFYGDIENHLKIREFRGKLLVKVLPQGQGWWGTSTKVKTGLNKRIIIPFAGAGRAKVSFRGCGVSYDGERDILGNGVTVSAKEVLGSVTKRVCALEGVVIQGDRVLRVSWIIWGYSHGFTPLPVPSFREWLFGIDRLMVDASAAAISFDGDFTESNSKLVYYDETDSHLFRAITVKGRSVICEWKYKPKVWSCRN